MPSVLSLIWLSIQRTSEVLAINVPCNVAFLPAFPTVSATLQILSKLFPVHQLLLGWLTLIDNYKFVWSRTSSQSKRRLARRSFQLSSYPKCKPILENFTFSRISHWRNNTNNSNDNNNSRIWWFFFMLRRPWDLRPLNFLPVVFSRMGLSDFHSKALGKQHEGIHRSLRELLHAVSFHHVSGTSWLREKLASAMSVLLFILLYLKINLKTDICTKIVWNAVVKMCQVEGRIFFNS